MKCYQQKVKVYVGRFAPKAPSVLRASHYCPYCIFATGFLPQWISSYPKYPKVASLIFRKKLNINNTCDLVSGGEDGSSLILCSTAKNQFFAGREMCLDKKLHIWVFNVCLLWSIALQTLNPGIVYIKSGGYHVSLENTSNLNSNPIQTKPRFSFGSGEWRDGQASCPQVWTFRISSQNNEVQMSKLKTL